MLEAKGEETFSGHLRRAIHGSGRLVTRHRRRSWHFLAGVVRVSGRHGTLRSDVLDRLAQAVRAKITVEPRRPERSRLGRGPGLMRLCPGSAAG